MLTLLQTFRLLVQVLWLGEWLLALVLLLVSLEVHWCRHLDLLGLLLVLYGLLDLLLDRHLLVLLLRHLLLGLCGQSLLELLLLRLLHLALLHWLHGSVSSSLNLFIELCAKLAKIVSVFSIFGFRFRFGFGFGF